MGPGDDPRSDSDLAAAIRAGDDSAFEALYYRYRDWVVRLAYRFTQHQDDSLDVLQETFAYLVRKSPALQLTASMKTFLYPVVRNLALEIRRKRRPDLSDALDFIPASPSRTSGRGELSMALARLPETHREVVLMRFVDDLKLEEIAEALGIPLGTVKSRLHNALSTLRSDPAAREYFET